MKRETSDIFTNNYNSKLMNIHRANIDVQFITDQYAVAQYVSNYLTKLEGGASALLRNINDEAIRQGEAGKVTLSKLVKALDRGREVAIQEAIYRLLGLTMTHFSEVVRFINSAHPHRRDGLVKKNADELPEGESVFHNSVHDYYMSRPINSEEDSTDWDKMSLAEFVSNYNIFVKKPKTERTEIITLQNKKGFVVKRSKQCVIRYFLRYENDEEYHRALCVLFLPFRDEMAEIHSENVTEIYETHQEEIEFVRTQFEKHRKLTDLVADVEKKQQNELGEIDEDDEEHQGLRLLETTDISNIEKYIEEAQATAIRTLNSSKPLQKMSDDEYLEKIASLNPEQRRIFDDLVERLNDVDNPDPFYLYIGGEAGTGKSYLLRMLMEAARKMPKMSGQQLDKPQSLTLAPTGVAAYNIHGMTIESGLGIMPGSNRSFTVGSQSRNSQFRFIYEDLKVIFIDEISMVDANKLNIINLRLREIRGNNLFMGGVSIICFGDFGQLPPVGNQMIWDKSTTDSRSGMASNLWDDNFKIFYLKMKMRSQDDKYSEVCDQVRRGELTTEVKEYLKACEKPCPSENDLQKYQQGKISIIVTTNVDRKKINSEKLHSLISDQPAVHVACVDKSTNVLNPPPIPVNQPLSKTGQLESEFTFKKGAPVMITANSQEPKYKMNGIVNGVRGYIDSFQFNQDGVLEVIWVRFNDDTTGQLLRLDNTHLLQSHKPDDKLAVPIFRMKKSFRQKEGNTNWLRQQFPLTLCFALTAHKVSLNLKVDHYF